MKNYIREVVIRESEGQNIFFRDLEQLSHIENMELSTTIMVALEKAQKRVKKIKQKKAVYEAKRSLAREEKRLKNLS